MIARSRARRAALVRAAAGLLGSAGPAAVTARGVAAAAGVPLAAVTYYFTSMEELLREAAEQLYDGYLAAARERVEQAGHPLTGDRLGEVLVRVWLDPADGGPDPRRVRGTLTALAAAADVPALAPRLRRYDAGLLGLVQTLLHRSGRDGSRARLLLAALDGLALARLCGVDVSGATVPGPASCPDGLLEGLVADLALVLDDLAPAQNSRAVGSSRPDSPT